jgi:hypothetical protein
MMQLLDGQDVYVSFVSVNDEAIVNRATVISAEHRLLRRSYGNEVLRGHEHVAATEAEALAACAVELRIRARKLDARADEIAAKAVACGVGPAKPE